MMISSACSHSVSNQQLLGKWKMVSSKISRDLGETWETYSRGNGCWIELLPGGEFKMTDPMPGVLEDGHVVSGEWHISNDSLFYLVPEVSALGGKCNAKIIKCDQNSLILQETNKHYGYIEKMYYIPMNNLPEQENM